MASGFSGGVPLSILLSVRVNVLRVLSTWVFSFSCLDQALLVFKDYWRLYPIFRKLVFLIGKSLVF